MLSTEDQALARQYDDRLQIVRDRTRGVATGWHTGFYLWGEGGLSKSWTVIDELEEIEAPFHLSNSKLSARGLFDLIEAFPDVVHVLEDLEVIFTPLQMAAASGVLRSALWSSTPDGGQQHRERLVTWRVHNEDRRVVFTGGIIMTMNCALDDLPQLRALKTRIPHLRHQPTNAEVRAKMREVACRGYRYGRGRLTADQCLEVCEYVNSSCDAAGRNYDFRMLIGGLHDRLQFEAGDSVHHWKEMIDSRMKERVTLPSRRLTRSEEVILAHRINAKRVPRDEKVAEWEAETGSSKNTFYRRLQEPF